MMDKPRESILSQAIALERMKVIVGTTDTKDLDVVRAAFSEMGDFAPAVPDDADCAAVRVLLSSKAIPSAEGVLTKLLEVTPAGSSVNAFACQGLSHTVVFVAFDQAKIRDAVFSSFVDRSEATTHRGVGIPEEVRDRLNIVRGSSCYGDHFLWTAADHFAHHVLNLCEDIPGAVHDENGDVTVVTAVPGSDIDGVLDWLRIEGPGGYATSINLLYPWGSDAV